MISYALKKTKAVPSEYVPSSSMLIEAGGGVSMTSGIAPVPVDTSRDEYAD